MARNTTNLKVEVIGDSRTRYLYPVLKMIMPELSLVHDIPGANIERISNAINNRIANKAPVDVIYVLVGINDVTKLLYNPRRIALRNINIEYAVTTLSDKFETLMERAATANTESGKKVKVIPMRLYGVDLAVYNNTPPPHPHQSLCEETIIAINNKINALALEYQAFAPYSERICHRYHPSRGNTHNYNNLQDGCHPYETTQQKIANVIVQSLEKTLHAGWLQGEILAE